MEATKAAFKKARTRRDYNRAKRLACALTGLEQLALVDTMIAAAKRVGA